MHYILNLHPWLYIPETVCLHCHAKNAYTFVRTRMHIQYGSAKAIISAIFGQGFFFNKIYRDGQICTPKFYACIAHDRRTAARGAAMTRPLAARCA